MTFDKNPYAPPAVETLPSVDSSEVTAVDLGAAGYARFIPPATRMTVAAVFVSLGILANLGVTGSVLLTQALLQRMADGYQPTATEIDGDTFRVGLAAGALIATRMIGAIAFLFWTYRVSSNLPALGVLNQEHSPGWAVGSYFVPILNLFRPY